MSPPPSRAYELGFRSVDREYAGRRLPVEGTVPTWLSGALIRNGPGRFEFGGERAAHWFDGLAMLRRYGFDDGTVTYTNRFLRSDARAAADAGDGAAEFATGGNSLRGTLGWLRSLGPPEPTDNANVHVARIGDHFVALTEAPRRIAFDPVTLETRGEFRWRDDIPEHLATAHLRVDPTREETIGFCTEFGLDPTYHLYRISHDRGSRTPIATVPAAGPGYVHDCSITDSHVVIVETPLRISIVKVLAPWTEGFLDLLEYDEDAGSRFVVVDRDTGAVVRTFETAPFFSFHHVNAFQDDDEVVVDLVAFEDDAIVRALSLEALAADGFEAAPDGRFRRYRLRPGDGRVRRSQRYDGGLELPTVPERFGGRRYRYAYAQATDRQGANGLVKLDVESGQATEWWERGVYVEEPRMVARPDAAAEDDGVVIAPALDTRRERSLLLVFDAETLAERARAPLPHAVPFGFHGRYFPDA
ncbi:carotenoid oxygenase family protein [Natrarchaeobaculum aegyptiacum]|uniref:Beta-carotene 15,15'-monooxygenase n=1 Tax=Natrarchaeobaculum aegyptiacum TaxID=745377 RepID=A0A2Z2HPV8_9EURY|nr:carotenoid oxygenase family protein [Natrarchaeobaculum aegyptiacum]ARS89051.1 beta-carotene 15,15'-monooxygenase [Natrarchaeobaculum aegyptiacum]